MTCEKRINIGPRFSSGPTRGVPASLRYRRNPSVLLQKESYTTRSTDPQSVLDRITELENEGLDVEQILTRLKQEIISKGGKQERYIFTKEYGWVDLIHWSEAANYAYELGPIGWEIATSLGFLKEVQQRSEEIYEEVITGEEPEVRSGFSPEDMPSDSAGGDFGENYAGHRGSLADAFKEWIDDVGGLPDEHPDANYTLIPDHANPDRPGKDGPKNPFVRPHISSPPLVPWWP